MLTLAKLILECDRDEGLDQQFRQNISKHLASIRGSTVWFPWRFPTNIVATDWVSIRISCMTNKSKTRYAMLLPKNLAFDPPSFTA